MTQETAKERCRQLPREYFVIPLYDGIISRLFISPCRMEMNGQCHTTLIVPTLAPTLHKFGWASHRVWAWRVKFSMSFQGINSLISRPPILFYYQNSVQYFYPHFSSYVMNTCVLVDFVVLTKTALIRHTFIEGFSKLSYA